MSERQPAGWQHQNEAALREWRGRPEADYIGIELALILGGLSVLGLLLWWWLT